MTSSNQGLKTNLASLICRRGVRGSFVILPHVFLSMRALEKIMPPSQRLCCLDWIKSQEDD